MERGRKGRPPPRRSAHPAFFPSGDLTKSSRHSVEFAAMDRWNTMGDHVEPRVNLRIRESTLADASSRVTTRSM
jgi:hypothetical protein